MDLALIHEGVFNLKNFRTTNKIKEDEEILTGYLTMSGLVPKEMFLTLTGVQTKGYEKFYWGNDKEAAHPAMGPVPFNVEAAKHILQISSVKYEEVDATIRKFKLEAVFGEQFEATFEILIHPKTDAVVGRLASRQGHDLKIQIKGPREEDMFAKEDASNVVKHPTAGGDGDGKK